MSFFALEIGVKVWSTRPVMLFIILLLVVLQLASHWKYTEKDKDEQPYRLRAMRFDFRPNVTLENATSEPTGLSTPILDENDISPRQLIEERMAVQNTLKAKDALQMDSDPSIPPPPSPPPPSPPPPPPPPSPPAEPLRVTESSLMIGNHSLRGPMGWNSLSDSAKRAYTMDGKSEVREWLLFGDSGWAAGTPVDYQRIETEDWSTERLTEMITIAQARNESRGFGFGGEVDNALYAAFHEYSIENKDVLVLRNRLRNPWIEAVALAFGARSVTSVGQVKKQMEDPKLIQTVTEEELGAQGESFDVLVSYSTLEREGLGRYGEPLNPDADLLRMHNLFYFMRPGGMFFLGVPMGPDSLTWNSHRVYGQERFPLLTNGWEKIDMYREERRLSEVALFADDYQPLQVLRLYPNQNEYLCCTPGQKKSFVVDSYGMAGPVDWDGLSEETRDEFLKSGMGGGTGGAGMGGKAGSGEGGSGEVGSGDKQAMFLKRQMFHRFKWAPGSETFQESSGSHSTCGRTCFGKLIDLAKANQSHHLLCPLGEECNEAFFEAVEKYPVKDQEVLVLRAGGQSPWIEALMLANGAKAVATVNSDHLAVEEGGNVQEVRMEDVGKEGQRYDVVVAFSVLEHEGLGRYGDRLDPWGDLKRMQKIQTVMKPNGMLFLGVPLGDRDGLIWNAARVYGPPRLQKLMQGWERVDTFGEKVGKKTKNLSHNSRHPLHILRLKNGLSEFDADRDK